MSAMNPSAELRDRVLQAARADTSPTRAQVGARATSLLASALAAPLITFWYMGGARAASRPPQLIALTATGALMIALAACFVGLDRGRSMLGRPSSWLVGSVVLAPLVLLAWKAGVSAHYEGMTAPWPLRPGFRCLGWSCLMAVWPLVSIVATRRRSDPSHPRLGGAAIGTAVGASIWVLVDLWCPVAYMPHLLLGHLLPLSLTILVGTLLGDRYLAPRVR
jgi:hypothetical protein